ncbi:MAG: DMT family transporter [Thermomicrobiales bacterium]|nr:DMT family transporter [Thermomicrobiales bacterium]
MGIAFGLAAALCWGLADYYAALASRRTGAFRVVLGFHIVATIALGIVVAATGALAGFDPADLWRFAWVGAIGSLSYLTFYKALEIGPISVLSPIISAYAAVSLILAVIVLDESLASGQLVAVLVVMLGVLLTSSDLRQVRTIERRQTAGLVLAFVTVIAIGTFVFGNAYYTIEYGWLVPIFLSRGFATVFLLAISAHNGSWRFPDRAPRLLALIALLAAVDTGGYVMFNIGAERAETSIVSTASAPYAVIPVIVGVLFLHERPAPVQWLGVAAVIGGVVLLGIFS